MILLGTRALLESHERSCREHRDRTGKQFEMVDKKIDELAKKVEKLDDKIDVKHQENTDKMDKILRYVWIAMGAGAMFTFFTSRDGMALLSRIFFSH